jgi:hypothetical protein
MNTAFNATLQMAHLASTGCWTSTNNTEGVISKLQWRLCIEEECIIMGMTVTVAKLNCNAILNVFCFTLYSTVHTPFRSNLSRLHYSEYCSIRRVVNQPRDSRRNYCKVREKTYIYKLNQKRNVPFLGWCVSKIILKNPNHFTDRHCKGFKHCFPCLFNETYTINEHAPLEQLLRQ